MIKNTKNKIKFIIDTLESLYPETPIPLYHFDEYSLLVAVLLSAQCKDERVNKIVPFLWEKAKTPQEMLSLSVEEIEKIIRPCGLSKKKSEAIYRLSIMLVEKFDSIVPNNFEELESLPGVGHKTASVVMSQAFGFDAFPVDTHIHRLAKRWSLSSGKNVIYTEKDLKMLFPQNKWNKLHLQMIFYGREYCPAKAHDINRCMICKKLSI